MAVFDAKDSMAGPGGVRKWMVRNKEEAIVLKMEVREPRPTGQSGLSRLVVVVVGQPLDAKTYSAMELAEHREPRRPMELNFR